MTVTSRPLIVVVGTPATFERWRKRQQGRWGRPKGRLWLVTNSNDLVGRVDVVRGIWLHDGNRAARMHGEDPDRLFAALVAAVRSYDTHDTDDTDDTD